MGKLENIPDGWVVVPIEPTEEMIKDGHTWSIMPGATWQDMIDASPLPPAAVKSSDLKITDDLIKLACIIISQEEVDGRGVCPDPIRFEDYVRTAARVFDANHHSEIHSRNESRIKDLENALKHFGSGPWGETKAILANAGRPDLAKDLSEKNAMADSVLLELPY